MVFAEFDGKVGYRWSLWVFLSEDTVVFRLDPTRSRDVPEAHFPADAQVVLMVDRYSAYKAMAQVKFGNIVLVFCWAHVRCDFVKEGKGWAELRSTVAAMQAQRVAELADPKLPTPCRKVLTSLEKHWTGLTRFVDDPQIPLDNNASERRVRGPALGRKNYYGSGAIWSGDWRRCFICLRP